MEAAKADLTRKLATETIFEILSNLSPTALALSARLSWRLHDIATSILYRDVYVYDVKARLFFLTLRSDTATARFYPTYVRSLTYSSQPLEHACLGFSLLCHALKKTVNVSSLSLSIPPKCSDILIGCLVEHGLIRKAGNIFDALESLSDCIPASTPYLLPRLDELSIHGELDLSRLCSFRKVRTLKLIEPMDYSDLAELYNNFPDGGSSKAALEHLDLVLSFEKSPDIVRAITGISEVFPGLLFIGIQAPIINALVMSNALKCQSLFASASCVSFNWCSTVLCHFKSQKDACLVLQERHVVAAGQSKRSLNILRFGNMRWTRRSDFKWDLEELELLERRGLPRDEVIWPNGYSTYYSLGRN